MKFPIVRNSNARTIADDIQSVVPETKGPKIVKTYRDYWGDLISVTESGVRYIQSISGHHDMYGDMGHEFLNGWYVVNESGERVFDGEDYVRIRGEFAHLWAIFGELRKRWSYPEFELMRGREGTLVVNDREVTGVEFTPKSLEGKKVPEAVEEISKAIEFDIASNKITPGVFGI